MASIRVVKSFCFLLVTVNLLLSLGISFSSLSFFSCFPCCLLNRRACQKRCLSSYVCLLALLLLINIIVHRGRRDREVPSVPRCPSPSTVGGPLETTRLEYVIQLADKQAEACMSNIDPHGLGTHAVGTIPMTLRFGMLPCCTPTEAKRAVEDYRGGPTVRMGGSRAH